MEEGKKTQKTPSRSFVTGAIALVFLIIGYEVAVFINKAAVTRIAANRDNPDTVYVYLDRDASGGGVSGVVSGGSSGGVSGVVSGGSSGGGSGVVSGGSSGGVSGRDSGGGEGDTLPGASAVYLRREGCTPSATQRKNSNHSPMAEAVRFATRRVESFRFNPNTVSVEDLQRLGFSEKQAQSIENYRAKGGRFRRPSDFAKSYVVADSVYARLEPFIDIPLLDINRADSVALLDLPGVGPYFAGKIVSYRNKLCGYSVTEQLMDIYHFDREKYDGLKDLITCSAPEPYPLWTLPEGELAKHPYISKAEAHGIVMYREHHAPAERTLDGLIKAGAISQEHATLLSRCLLEQPR